MPQWREFASTSQHVPNLPNASPKGIMRKSVKPSSYNPCDIQYFDIAKRPCRPRTDQDEKLDYGNMTPEDAIQAIKARSYQQVVPALLLHHVPPVNALSLACKFGRVRLLPYFPK